MHLLLKKIKENKFLHFILFISIVEIFLTTLIIFYTGGINSYFFIFYLLVILNFSSFRFPYYPFLISLLSFIAYLILILGQFYKIIPYINYLSFENYNLSKTILIQNILIVGLFLLITSFYANTIIKNLNREKKILELLREGSLLLTSYIGDRVNFLKSIVKIAREVTDADSASIVEYDDERYRFIAWDNLTDDFIRNVEEKFNLSKPFNLEKIREEKKILKFDDVYKLPYWVKTENIRSYIGAPIFFKDKVYAILNIDSKKLNKFNSSDVVNVEILTKIISTTFEKDYLFNEINELNKKLENLSIKDHLTSLYNRRKLEEVLKYEINIFLRREENFQLIMMDVDNFKMINDTLGHIEGDEILIKIGEIFNKNLRKVDFLFRYGGDEFIIIIPNSPPPTVEIVMKRIDSKFKEKLKNYIDNYKIGLSYGYLSFKEFYMDIINKYPEKSYDDDFLFFHVLKYVDTLLYSSKKLKHIY